jgi:hypothetical protein
VPEQGLLTTEAATEAYFTKSAQDGGPPTMEGLREAIREVLVQPLGPPPKRRASETRADVSTLNRSSAILGGAAR